MVVTNTQTRTITDVKKVESETTKHKIEKCKCTNCGAKDIEPDTLIEINTDGSEGQSRSLMPADILPEFGELGWNAITEIFSRYMDRTPHGVIARAMRDMGVPVSTATVYKVVSGVGKLLGAEARKIRKACRKADILNIDETGLSLNGKQVWAWIFYDPLKGNTSFEIQPSRGNDVPEETLGRGWKGVVVCDGWNAYNRYYRQRCWAHLMNEIKHVCKTNPLCKGAWTVKKRLGTIFAQARQAADLKDLSHRRKWRKRLAARIKRLVDRYKTDKKAREFEPGDTSEEAVLRVFMTKLDNARRYLFTFLVDPRIPPTNNAAERGLREFVVHRKVRGCIRTEETMEWMANIFTCMTTWKNKGLNRLTELAAALIG